MNDSNKPPLIDESDWQRLYGNIADGVVRTGNAPLAGLRIGLSVNEDGEILMDAVVDQVIDTPGVDILTIVGYMEMIKAALIAGAMAGRRA